MNDILLEIISKIEILNPVHGKKLRANLTCCDTDYYTHAAFFLKKYAQYLRVLNKDLDYAVGCYLRVVSDMVYEQIRFLQTGAYSRNTFFEVNEKVYSNADIMEYHTQGLLLSQTLWMQHYNMLIFFTHRLPDYQYSVKNYLEIGAGHGLYVSEAIKILKKDVHIDVVDISPTAIEIAKHFIDDDSVNYTVKDIFSYRTDYQYDFITMGEVLEHVEDPVALLLLARKLLNDKGVMYITAPANAPAIDHIFLFNNISEIRNVIERAGFNILSEATAFSENIPREKAEKFKVPLMYGAFINKTLTP